MKKIADFPDEFPGIKAPEKTPNETPWKGMADQNNQLEDDVTLKKQKPSTLDRSVSSYNAVREMQSEILNLANKMSESDLFAFSPKQDNDKGGSDPFGNFLVSNYINPSQGKQLFSADVPENLKQSPNNINLRGIVNSLLKIGKLGKDDVPDGIWGARTENALKQIYSIAKAFINIGKDLNLKLSGYGEADLSNFALPKEDANGNPIFNNDIEEKAKVLTNEIKKIINLYNSFKDLFENDPRFSNIISQKESIHQLPSSKEVASENLSSMLSKDEVAFYNKNSDKMFMQNMSIYGDAIPVKAMETMNSFKSFLSAIDYPTDENSIKSLLSQMQNSFKLNQKFMINKAK